MNCPYCNTTNDPSNPYCIACGRPLNFLHAQKSARGLLWIVSGRFFFILLFLFIMKAVVNSLNFVQDTTIPEVNIRATLIINLVVFAALIVLLVAYLQSFGRLWPQAFPRFHEAAVIVTSILYLIALNQLYLALDELLPLFIRDSQVIPFIAVALMAVAIFLVIRAFVIVYQALPGWLSAIQFSVPPYPAPAPQPPQDMPASRN